MSYRYIPYAYPAVCGIQREADFFYIADSITQRQTVNVTVACLILTQDN